MPTVCEFPNTLAITSWLVIKAIKVVHTVRAQCYTVANTGKLKLKSNLASVRHGEIYGNLIGSHVYWWQWPWHYLVAYFHIPSKHVQRIIFTAHLRQAQLKSIRFVNSSAQVPYFLKLTADVTTSGWLGKVCWGLPFFLKLKIMETLFTKPLETVRKTIFKADPRIHVLKKTKKNPDDLWSDVSEHFIFSVLAGFWVPDSFFNMTVFLKTSCQRHWNGLRCLW